MELLREFGRITTRMVERVGDGSGLSVLDTALALALLCAFAGLATIIIKETFFK